MRIDRGPAGRGFQVRGRSGEPAPLGRGLRQVRPAASRCLVSADSRRRIPPAGGGRRVQRGCGLLDLARTRPGSACRLAHHPAGPGSRIRLHAVPGAGYARRGVRRERQSAAARARRAEGHRRGRLPAMKEELELLVEHAQAGDRAALNELVRRLIDDVYRLALRMTANRADAEDAAQEVMIKAVTHLGSFRGESSVRTWVYRIAVRHLLDRPKSRVETFGLDFERFAADLLDGLEPGALDEDPAAAEEVKLGCTLAMLTCLDREHRVAYILGEVFDVPAAAAA